VSLPDRIELASLEASAAPGLTARVRAARLVCFATDTVYGIGGALTEEVLAELLAVKRRGPGKPVQVVFPSLSALETAVPMMPPLRAACRSLLPGPVTLIVPSPLGWRVPPPGEPETSRGGTPGAPGRPLRTLGVRVPAWPPAARVMVHLGIPLMASSANLSGASAPAEVGEVEAAVFARCDLVLDAGRVDGRASAVVDLSRYAADGRWRLVRAGAWHEDEIAARLDEGRDAPKAG
jgi:L-threonylcarbamoyladenylate synthase